MKRQSFASCIAYTPIESTLVDQKYSWHGIPCDMKAPFICKHNPDFLGFHRLDHLVLDVTVNVKMPSMSLTTCFAICHSTPEPSNIAFILGDQCICGKGKKIFILNQ